MCCRRLLFLLSFAFFAVASPNSTSLWIPRLTVNYENAVVDQRNPSFGWAVYDVYTIYSSQSAYRIIVASTEELLNSERPDLWDTGKIYSNESWNIRYEGKAVEPGQTVFAGVKIWDQNDLATVYTKASWRQEFNTAHWTAKWISPPESLLQTAFTNILPEEEEIVKSHPGIQPVLYFRKIFSIEDPIESAIVYCSAKGMFIG